MTEHFWVKTVQVTLSGHPVWRCSRCGCATLSMRTPIARGDRVIVSHAGREGMVLSPVNRNCDIELVRQVMLS